MCMLSIDDLTYYVREVIFIVTQSTVLRSATAYKESLSSYARLTYAVTLSSDEDKLNRFLLGPYIYSGSVYVPQSTMG